MSIFYILAKQPSSVSNMQGFAMSPYVVHVDWDPPKQRSSKPLMYRLVIMDEFENPLLETDLSDRTYERDELQPATKYKVIYMFSYGSRCKQSLPLGFLTKQDPNPSSQLYRLARKFKKSLVASLDTILSQKRITKALISKPKDRVSRVEAHIMTNIFSHNV